MKVIDLSLLPTSIDITLYKYNYIDNKLWTQLKNQVDYIEVNNNSIIITKNQLHAILLNNYSDEINKIKSVGSKFFHNQVNTIYFTWMMMNEMKSLQYIKLTLNKDKSYTRILMNSNDEKTIEFDFKLLSITIKLTEIFDENEIKIINDILYNLDIIDSQEPYIRLKAVELIEIIDSYLSTLDEDILSEEAEIITELLEIFTYKIERDNPLTLLVTDY